MTDNLAKTKKIIEEFFEKMTFQAEVKILPLKENTLSVEVKTEEPQILIGEGGETLLEIQRLLRLILRKHFAKEEQFYVDLDINDYKKKKLAYLKDLAKNAAEEVVLTKKEKSLPPMSSYERRVVHMELANNPNIKTESVGQGQERKVVVKPLLES